MATKGSRQVSITNLNDKWQMTILNTAGELLPATMIYGEMTEKCHPPQTSHRAGSLHTRRTAGVTWK